MINLIDKFYNDLQAKFLINIEELIGSLVISNNAKKLVDHWDDIMDHLEKIGDELQEILESEDDAPLCEDYIKMGSLYLVYALMAKLDEKFDRHEGE